MLKFAAQQSIYNASTGHMGDFLSFFSLLFIQMLFVCELFEQKFPEIRGCQHKKEKHVLSFFMFFQIMNK